MSRKIEHLIFFTALIIFGVALVGSIAYFKIQEPNSILTNNATSTQNQGPSIETIPTSSIITTAHPTSSIVLPPLIIPYSITASTSNEIYWPKAWGNISYTKNSLALLPDPSYHGANSFLNGSASWTNYSVTANVSPLMGGWFDVVTRVASNTQDFVYCEFGPNGTEAIERVNGVDTQLAHSAASTTAVEDATENFGMEVYGHDMECLMGNEEVVGVQVTDGKESPSGGIGFVIFGAPSDQKQVTVSDVYVSPLSGNDIMVPFPAPVISPPIVTPPPITTPPPPPTPPPVITTTTKTLPYVEDIFSQNDGWNTWWGNFSLATDSLTMAAGPKSTSGGALLDGTTAWDNYTFTANLDWLKGQTFGLYARYTNSQNYVVCVFSQPYLGEVDIKLEQHVNGAGYTLAQGSVTNWNQWGGTNIPVAIQVLGVNGSCSFDNNVVVSAGEGFTLNPPFSGKIGFTTSDPRKNNADIVVHSIDVEPKS